MHAVAAPDVERWVAGFVRGGHLESSGENSVACLRIRCFVPVTLEMVALRDA